MLEGFDLFSADRHAVEGEIEKLRSGRSPQKLRFTKHARRRNFDILK